MTTTTTILDIPARTGEHVSRARTSCWCGQDLELVTRTACPRCGRHASRWAGR